MKLENTYKEMADDLRNLQRFEGGRSVGWKSPSNIALVKYWGKREVQLPQNPSISFALNNSFSETRIEYNFSESNDVELAFLFENKRNEAFEKRVKSYFEGIIDYLPFINNLSFKIESANSFPHSAGIASSASAMSALALCLVSIEREMFDTLKIDNDFFKKASFLARLGSGSAARSVYGDYSVWGQSVFVSDSSDEIAINYDNNIDADFLELGDAILIASSKSKKVSSSMGHKLMIGHPYADSRYKQANENLENLLKALASNNEKIFIDVVENEALSLHALMMSSSNGYSLLNQNTWEIIHKIRNFRKDNNTFAAFTLDAGPNVHLIYKLKDRKTIEDFIKKELTEHCENNKWIDDKMGSGPDKIL